MWYTMQRYGLPKNMEEALELVRASPTQTEGFALLADATDVRYCIYFNNVLGGVCECIKDNIFVCIHSSRYLAMTNCDLQMVGEEFSRKPYALAVQQGSPLKDSLNDA